MIDPYPELASERSVDVQVIELLNSNGWLLRKSGHF